MIGIRLVGEWFPTKTVGMDEGVYGGWGNIGSAAAFWLVPGFLPLPPICLQILNLGELVLRR